MNPTVDAFLCSWPSDPWLVAGLVLTGGVYLRGWLLLRRRGARRWRGGQLAAFCGGLAAIFLALASPIEPFAALLLQVHMVQHLLLMMVAPPLLWLGAPLVPLLRGLPRPVRIAWVSPLLGWCFRQPILRRMAHPFVAWPLYVGMTWLWHTPRGYELGLQSSNWHLVEHACFIGSAMLFWYPVVLPYPARPSWSRWILFPYLILADVQNTVLAAWLTFSGGVIYPHYAQVPRLDNLSVLDDQAVAGVLMWVPGSIAFLLPLVWIGVGWLRGSESKREPRRARGGNIGVKLARPSTNGPFANPVALLPVIDGPRHAPLSADRSPPAARFDLLKVPLIGHFLRWRKARLGMQVILAVLAAAVIFDGFCGPRSSPMNLAGVLPWIHWRGAVILALLAAGNVFCMACPFTLPRSLARRWLPSNRRWPRWLRNKWLAVLLLVLFLWSYEAFALWDNPWWTAWIAVGYFIASFAVDGFFRGAAFCKYVCPIGQFNFVQSLVSPLEVSVRQPTVCASCRTRECIRGTSVIPGCQTNLFLPRKSGNLDCTFCLDCVHACPHENIGLLAVLPGQTLLGDPARSGIGRFSRRPDLAALVLLLVFGAFANAAGMVAPVADWLARARSLLGDPPLIAATSVYYFATLLVLPAVAIGTAAAVSRWWGRLDGGWLDVATRYAYALIPLGFGMWLAHYSFHFLTSYGTILPATQRFAADLGWSVLGKPLWQCACCRPAADWVLHLEILMLDLGLLLSLFTGYRIAESQTSRAAQSLKAFAPWGVLTVLLFVVGVWIVFQPMQMRGTLPAAG